jgi:hypothetical protein
VDTFEMIRGVRGWVVLALLTAANCGDDAGRTGLDGGTSNGIVTAAPTGSGAEGADETGEKFDAGAGGGMGNAGDCPGQMGSEDEEYDFSYIWIANSPEGTVSKINTFTGVEEGRYRTGPLLPDPSRTSVNQFGDVAVANRNGGIAKIAAKEVSCVDNNGDGVIQTSTGAADILPWGEDECLLWYQDLPALGTSGPRPVAWEPVDSQCGTVQPRVWVGFYRDSDDTGIFHRRDGATGALLDVVEIPQWDFGNTPRPYGGAVNADGDLWVTGYYGPAIKIDADTLGVQHFPPPDGTGFYGMALDPEENIWIGDCEGAIRRFDAATLTYSTVATIEGRARGVQIDEAGMAWFAGNNPCRLIQVDTATQALVDDQIPLPGCDDPVGVSIDVEGYVWVVDRGAEEAYKVDPVSKQVVLTVTGLVEPYTYSDMTGNGLGLVVNTPQG